MKAAAAMVALALAPSQAAAQALPVEALECGGELPPGVELRITYGPHWDGTWRLSSVHPEDGPPVLMVEIIEGDLAAHRADIVATHTRPAGAGNLRELRRAAATMIAEMDRVDERPELRAERRPLTVQVRAAEQTMCADGYANWPRIPGTYFFDAVVHLRDGTVRSQTMPDPWPAVRLKLRQIRSAWR